LIDFRVKAEENVWPMVPAGASLAETVEEPREKPARAAREQRNRRIEED